MLNKKTTRVTRAKSRPCANPECGNTATTTPYCTESCRKRYKAAFLDEHQSKIGPLIDAAGGIYQDEEGTWWMKHWASIYNEEARGFRCFICGKIAPSSGAKTVDAARQHMSRHHRLQWLRVQWRFVPLDYVDPVSQRPVEDEDDDEEDEPAPVQKAHAKRRNAFPRELCDEDGNLAWYRPDFLARVDTYREKIAVIKSRSGT